ncbi:protein PAT1 homolog 1-like [Anneissia japonica]|uniref:protein PAT1 homolog 1-like n=1 Tax=Anneissia japonica TaxID=1529436 RepID=UPI0014258FDD|nr:protein PAT1 homolog 1-like [Anneissia japonica]
MSNFFEFDSSMPPLEEFPEDEEYDVLNDETFGSGAVEEWQADVDDKGFTKNSVKVISKHGSSQSKASPNDSGFASAEQLQFQEDELEHSISQLVLDEDLDDPAIRSATRKHPATTYMRSSSPAAPFSDDLLSSTNIWGSPAHHSSKEDELKAILGIGRDMNDARLQDSAIMSAIPSQNRIVTAEELEKDLRSRAPPARSVSPVIGSPPASSMMPIGTPPRHQYMQMTPGVIPVQTPPQILPSPMQPSIHQLTQQILQKTGGSGNPQQINHMIQRMLLNSGRVSPTPIANAILASFAQGHQQMSPRPGFTRSPFHHFQQGRVPSSPMSMPGRGPSTPGMGHRGGMMGSPHQHSPHQQSPHQQNAVRHYSGGHGGDGYNRNYNQHNFHSPNQYGQFNRNNRHFRPNRNESRGHPSNQNTHNGVNDEYANLMTQKEKDWVLRIQMLQLQTDDPMVEDFYYQMFIQKQKAKEQCVEGIQSEGQNKEKKPKVLLPPPKLEIREYKPMQFSGALGKLTAVSVNNPRKIIDIDMGNSIDEDEDSKTKAVIHSNKQQKALLMKIEKLYILMLSINDLKRQLDDAKEVTDLETLRANRKTLQEKLFSGLHIEQQLKDRTLDDQFINLVSVRKGRKLIGRSLDVLDSHYSCLVVEAVLKNLSILIKREMQDAKKEMHQETLPAMYPPLLKVIQSAELSQLTSFVSQLISHEEKPVKPTQVTMALQHKFGSSVVLGLVNQAEDIYTNSSLVDIDNATQEAWTNKVNGLASEICAIDTAIAPSYQANPNALKHFGRFVSKHTYIALDRRLGSLNSI